MFLFFFVCAALLFIAGVRSGDRFIMMVFLACALILFACAMATTETAEAAPRPYQNVTVSDHVCDPSVRCDM